MKWSFRLGIHMPSHLMKFTSKDIWYQDDNMHVTWVAQWAQSQELPTAQMTVLAKLPAGPRGHRYCTVISSFKFLFHNKTKQKVKQTKTIRTTKLPQKPEKSKTQDYVFSLKKMKHFLPDGTEGKSKILGRGLILFWFWEENICCHYMATFSSLVCLIWLVQVSTTKNPSNDKQNDNKFWMRKN